jgi:hypothetical protein
MTTTAVNALSHVLILRVLIATIVEPAPGGDHRFREPSRCPERNCRLDTKAGARSMPSMHRRMSPAQERGIYAPITPSFVLLPRNLVAAGEILV